MPEQQQGPPGAPPQPRRRGPARPDAWPAIARQQAELGALAERVARVEGSVEVHRAETKAGMDALRAEGRAGSARIEGLLGRRGGRSTPPPGNQGPAPGGGGPGRAGPGAQHRGGRRAVAQMDAAVERRPPSPPGAAGGLPGPRGDRLATGRRLAALLPGGDRVQHRRADPAGAGRAVPGGARLRPGDRPGGDRHRRLGAPAVPPRAQARPVGNGTPTLAPRARSTRPGTSRNREGRMSPLTTRDRRAAGGPGPARGGGPGDAGVPADAAARQPPYFAAARCVTAGWGSWRSRP